MPRESEDWRPSPEREHADTEMQQILAEAVEKLEPEYRIVLVLRDVEELSAQDTEEALGITMFGTALVNPLSEPIVQIEY